MWADLSIIQFLAVLPFVMAGVCGFINWLYAKKVEAIFLGKWEL
jgi:hypothetical protein